MMSSDRAHAVLDSHTYGRDNCSDHLDAAQLLPNLCNFELNSHKKDPVSPPASSLLLDGRLESESNETREPQERSAKIIQTATAAPAKQRAPPPPPLNLAIPERPRAQNEWHIVSRSAGLSDSSSATQSTSEHSGVGAGYFSPPQSPLASPSTAVPTATPLLKSARLRARSVVRGDLLKPAAGKQKMVKERRSLQSLLMSSFLPSLQPQSTPLGLVPGPRTEVPRQSSDANSLAPSGAGGNSVKKEKTRSFYGRRRSQTYSGRDSELTSPSSASSSTRVPPMPEAYTPPTSGPATGGRESPSAYLLDEDPFAVSPAQVAPPVNTPSLSPAYTPMHSPTHSLTHSRSPSTVSLSSTSSTSMPGTPVFQSFGVLPEDREREAISPNSATSPSPSALIQSVPIPLPPPPTPTSPLNPNATAGGSISEATRLLRKLSATPSTPLPILAQTQLASASPLSPTNLSGDIPSLPHPPPSRARPAHTRPAFSSRPSLPSLSALSRMSTAAGELASTLRGKKRRGKVGAGLPAEPWDLPTPEPSPEEQTTENQEDGDEDKDEMDRNEDDGQLNSGEAENEGEENKSGAKPENDSWTSREPCSSSEHPSDFGITRVVEPSDTVPAIQSDVESTSSPSPVPNFGDAGTPKVLASGSIQLSGESMDASHTAELDAEKPETEDSENPLQRLAECEDGNGKGEGLSGLAHGEGGVSVDAGLSYTIKPPCPSSESVEDMNGESTVTTAVLATLSDNAPLSEMLKERDGMRAADQEADQLNEGDDSLNVGLPADELNGDGCLDRLAGPEPSSSLVNIGSAAITIPGRASAIPKHVLRTLTPYPFGAPRSASPVSSIASWSSSQSSVEDFGILLSSSPAFRGDQRPESLTIDPGLPDASSKTDAYTSTQLFPVEEDQANLKDSTSSPSSSAALSPSLPSLISREGGDPEIEAASDTEADFDLGSSSDAVFASEGKVHAESPTATCATSSDLSLHLRESLSSSPFATPLEPDGLERSASPSPIRADEVQVQYASSFDDRSLSPAREEDHTDYYLEDYDPELEDEQYARVLEEDDDSSMLPPLSTLPEDDPVFSLSPARSLERYGPSEYLSASSRSVSRKASVATIASIFSMRSGSSGGGSQNSNTYSRTHSPAASLSTTLPFSNSQTSSGTGSLAGRRVYGSSTGSPDSGRGHAQSSSVSSLRSKSSFDLRGLASIRRHGSQSSGLTMLSHSSTRTKCDPHVPSHTYKKPSVEDVTLGLRAYAGNPYAVAAQAELEGEASKDGLPSTARYDDDELIIDIRREDVAPVESGAVLSGWRPYDSMGVAIDAFEPGSSAGTLRPLTKPLEGGMREGHAKIGSRDGLASVYAHAHTSGYSYSNTRGGAGKGWGNVGGCGNGHGQSNESSGSDYSGDHGGAPGAGRSGRGNSRGDDEDWQNRKPSVPSPSSSSEDESESESESDADKYGEQSPGIAQSSPVHASSLRTTTVPVQAQDEPISPIFTQLRNGRKGVFRPPSTTTADNNNLGHPPTAEDDDVPLAQRIPGALKAQKSIRQQVRSERDRRRRERSVASTPRTSRAPEGTISPPPQHIPGTSQNERGRTLTVRLPRTAPLGGEAAPLSSSQEAAMMAQRTLQTHHATHAVRRPRAKTLGGPDGSGVPPDDLAKRLLRVQARDQDAPMPVQRTSAVSSVHPTSVHVYDKSPVERSSDVQTQMMSRRRAASPPAASYHMQQQVADLSGPPARTLRPMRSLHGLSSSVNTTAPAPVPPVPAASIRHRSPSRARQSHDVEIASDALLRNKSIRNARSPSDKSGGRSEEESPALPSHHPYAQSHAVPSMPAVSRGPSPPAPLARHNVVQTRIYINNMQRFNVVEASLETSARDVLDMLRQQGDLRGEERRSSSWMLYEVCHDFGMERPVRSFELVTDISGSWNKEKSMNCFMVKLSPFTQSLSNIPSSIPTRSGFVDYEVKKGKWNKRWLELREHGLWISKREGKDDEFLCSLSAFDAYIVTRLHKATKNFTFAVKSTDPITLFENKADYLHAFCVPEDTGVAWLEAIWLARSYILYQEKNVLFRNKNAAEGPGSGASAGVSLARSGTRKKPAQTYITLPQPKVPGAAETVGPFEPGSLLARRVVT